MANCSRCNAPLSLSERFAGFNGLCKKCATENELEKKNQIEKMKSTIGSSKQISEDYLLTLKKFQKHQQIEFYNSVLSHFDSDGELDTHEISVLDKMINCLDFSYDDVKFTDTVWPYYFVAKIREDGFLPDTKYSIGSGMGQLILKKGEHYHFGAISSLREMKVVNLGYKGGSAGVSVPVVKGVRFHVGRTRGQIMKSEQLVETSRGLLSVTSQRIILTPLKGFKPVSIPLKNILSYSCYSNGLEIYKEGRDKGFCFTLPNAGSSEIFGICLAHLLSE